nr:MULTISPECIES: 6-hydroxymethylpterin diphosphokinase MptE-like protein [unclassified Ectothiorhodospira]
MAFAKPFVLVLGSALTTLKVHLATQIKAADLFLSNTFHNLPYMADAPGIQDIRGAWKGQPLLLISAGPSLDQHLEIIRAFKDRVLLVAVGQAWRTLRKADIEPHFVVTVDPFEGNLPHFEGMESMGASLLADAGTHPLIVKQFTGRRIFCHSTHPVDLLMSQVCGERGVLPTGGSVANTAFSFAVNLSADPIILVGQDLAFTGGQTHVTGNAYRQAVDSIAEEKRKSWREVPGYDGGKVITNSQMDVYRHWFERFILNQPELRVINSTEGGAHIEGARQLPLSDALNMFASDKAIDINGLWPSDFEVSTPDELKRRLHGLRLKLSEFKELSEDIVHLAGELGSLQDLNGELQGVPGAAKLNSRLKTRFRKFRRLKHPARVMVEAFTSRSRIGAHTVLQKQEKDESLSSRQGLSLAQGFYRDVAKGCDQGIKLLEQTLSEVHKKMSDKKV